MAIRFSCLMPFAIPTLMTLFADPSAAVAPPPPRPDICYLAGTLTGPKGQQFSVSVWLTVLRSGEAKGSIAYNIGIRQQSFAIEGRLDDRGNLTLAEDSNSSVEYDSKLSREVVIRDKRPWVHPHSPSSGGARFTGVLRRGMRTWLHDPDLELTGKAQLRSWNESYEVAWKGDMWSPRPPQPPASAPGTARR